MHFLQIWIQPNVSDIPPSYEEKHFDAGREAGRLRLIASQDGEAGSVRVHQDVRVYGGLFDAAEHAELSNSRRDGARTCTWRAASVHVNGVELNAGDALKLTDEPRLADRAGREVRSPGVRPAG